MGLVTKLDAAKAIAGAGAAGADIVNCSFGGTSLFHSAPIALERALAALPPSTIVVASAGSQGVEQPRGSGAVRGGLAAAPHRSVRIGERDAVGVPGARGPVLEHAGGLELRDGVDDLVVL